MLNWTEIIISLIGGLALFLYGMSEMTRALKSAAGSSLTSFLSRMTHNRWTALVAGTVITAVIQSSSITTVLTVGFVSAGLLSFSKTLGIILGANIGTTITAQIIAFKITEASLILVAAGYLANALAKSKKRKDYGSIFIGLGLVFLGMELMGQATMPLRTYGPFIDGMAHLSHPALGILAGAAFTAVVQSSSATTGVVIVLASQGLITLEASIAMVIGANIGTCVTALLAVIGKPRAALQVAMSHVSFKLIGAMLWVMFIPYLADFIRTISDAGMGRQVAHAHTVFNVANAMLFIGFTKSFARFIQWLVPDKKEKTTTMPLLDGYYLGHASLALEMVDKTLIQMGYNLKLLSKKSVRTAISGDAKDLGALRKAGAEIDRKHGQVLAYIGQIQQLELTEKESKHVKRQSEVANILDLASDMFSTTLVDAAQQRLKIGFKVSDETCQQLTALSDEAVDALHNAILAYQTRSSLLAGAVTKSKKAFAAHHQRVHNHVYTRLADWEEHRASIIRFELELLEVNRRLHSLARRLARRAS